MRTTGLALLVTVLTLAGAAPARAAATDLAASSRQARATLDHANGDLAGAKSALARAAASAKSAGDAAADVLRAAARTPCDVDTLRRAVEHTAAVGAAEADLAQVDDQFGAARTHVTEISALLAAYDAARAQAPTPRLRALDTERAEIEAGRKTLETALAAWAATKDAGTRNARTDLTASVTALKAVSDRLKDCAAARPAARDEAKSEQPTLQGLRRIISGLPQERPILAPLPFGYGTPYYQPEPPPRPSVPVLIAPPPRSERRCTQENEDERARCEQRRARDLERAQQARRAAEAADQRARALTREEPEPYPTVLPPVIQPAPPDPQAVARLAELIRKYAPPSPPPPPPPPATSRIVPNQVIAALRAAAPATVSDLETRVGLFRLEAAALPSIGVELVLFEVTGGQTVAGATAALAADPRVLSAQPNFVSETAADHRDPMATLQYGPLLIKVPAAHARVTGRAVRVAVIDTGVDAHHPDLIGRIATRANFADGPDVGEVHGTAVAGIIAATADNGIGIYGVAPEAAVVAARACRPRVAGQAEGVCTSWGLTRALDWALASTARVVNLSVAGPPDPLLGQLVARAHERGVVVVAAVGNLGPAAPPTYPAAFPGVIGVTAVDAKTALYAAAVHGPFVSVAAPGVEVLSAQPGAKFAVLTGTSMAAAHVSGVTALLLQARGDLSPAAVRQALEDSAQALGPGTGHGLVDGCRAVSGALGGRLGC